MVVVRLAGVARSYRSGQVHVDALRGVDLAVESGEFVSIMGPSGSGKSTLLNLIGCLDRPTSGSREVAGRLTDRMSDGALADLRNRFLGFVFQDFRLMPDLDALANVELPLVYRGLPARERHRLAMAALEAVGLAARAHHRPSQLSGGEQQRVAIARALVGRPALILADEPTGALDSHSSRVIMAIFQRVNREQGLTVVQVTHDERVARHASRLIRLLDGRVVSDEPVADRLLADETGEEAPAAGAAALPAGAAAPGTDGGERP
ncbi:MAG: ABC transporter ATP-binding protein [Bacillota bacterium]|nr:ABC transporter ATP-binding protein [Bacillota bacterium]